MSDKLKVVVTDASVKVPKLREMANVVQYDKPGPMPRSELLDATKDADAIFCLLRDKIDKEFLENAKKLKIIGSMAVGYDHIDIDECQKRHIKVGNTPNVLTEATAELGVALLLTTARRIPEAIHASKEGTAPIWTPYWMCGKGIQGSTIGFYGCGRIGENMVEKLRPFKPKRIIYNNRKPKEDSTLEFVSFDDLLKESDFLIITVAQTKETIGKFNKENLLKMKKDSILINTSRGGLIKMMDLYEVMKSGHLFAAGLDVTDPEPLPTDHPLFTLNNCVILPHIGSATYDARNAMAQLTEDNIYNALLGKEMPASVI